MPALFVAAIGVTLFVLAFLTKRRFGVLGLALAAGSLISASGAALVTPFLESQGLSLQFMPLSIFVQASLLLLPAILLLVGGPTYKESWARMLGSLAFALLAVVFLLEPLGDALRLDGPSLQAYQFVAAKQNIIIVAGLSLAVVDLLFARSKHKGRH